MSRYILFQERKPHRLRNTPFIVQVSPNGTGRPRSPVPRWTVFASIRGNKARNNFAPDDLQPSSRSTPCPSLSSTSPTEGKYAHCRHASYHPPMDQQGRGH